MTEHKLWGVRRPFGIVFLCGAVHTKGVQEQVPAAGEDPEQHLIAPEELIYPTELELFAPFEFRRRVEMRERSHCQIDQIPRH